MITDLLLVYHGLNEQGAYLGSLGAANLVEEPDDDAKKFFKLSNDVGQLPCMGFSYSK